MAFSFFEGANMDKILVEWLAERLIGQRLNFLDIKWIVDNLTRFGCSFYILQNVVRDATRYADQFLAIIEALEFFISFGIVFGKTGDISVDPVINIQCIRQVSGNFVT